MFSALAQRQSGQAKFTKAQAYFVKKSMTAAQCQNCPWYVAPETESGTPTCRIVSEEGPPDPGKITPNGICGLYFTGPLRVRGYGIAYGRGVDKTGALPQNIRRKVEVKRMSADDPKDIPPELQAQ